MAQADYILEVVEGPDAGRTVPVDGPLEIGRHATLGVVLSDRQASRRHARVSPGQGVALVEDLESSNGSYVNDEPVYGSREMRPGDLLRVGLTVLQLRSANDTVQGSAVRPRPSITALGDIPPGPHQPPVAAEQQPPAYEQPQAPRLRQPTQAPAFVDTDASEGDARGPGYEAVAALVDARVKHQTNVAAFAVLAIGGLAVLIFFGVR